MEENDKSPKPITGLIRYERLKSWKTAMFLALFFAAFGVHYFYLRQYWKG